MHYFYKGGQHHQDNRRQLTNRSSDYGMGGLDQSFWTKPNEQSLETELRIFEGIQFITDWKQADDGSLERDR